MDLEIWAQIPLLVSNQEKLCSLRGSAFIMFEGLFHQSITECSFTLTWKAMGVASESSSHSQLRRLYVDFVTALKTHRKM